MVMYTNHNSYAVHKVYIVYTDHNSYAVHKVYIVYTYHKHMQFTRFI